MICKERAEDLGLLSDSSELLPAHKSVLDDVDSGVVDHDDSQKRELEAKRYTPANAGMPCWEGGGFNQSLNIFFLNDVFSSESLQKCQILLIFDLR